MWLSAGFPWLEHLYRFPVKEFCTVFFVIFVNNVACTVLDSLCVFFVCLYSVPNSSIGFCVRQTSATVLFNEKSTMFMTNLLFLFSDTSRLYLKLLHTYDSTFHTLSLKIFFSFVFIMSSGTKIICVLFCNLSVYFHLPSELHH